MTKIEEDDFSLKDSEKPKLVQVKPSLCKFFGQLFSKSSPNDNISLHLSYLYRLHGNNIQQNLSVLREYEGKRIVDKKPEESSNFMIETLE